MIKYKPLPIPGSNQFWGSACQRMHTHEYIAFFLRPDLKRIKKKKKKRKKKDRHTDPPDFQAERANKPFIILRLKCMPLLSDSCARFKGGLSICV